MTEIERVENETEGKKIQGVYAENDGVDSENEGVYNEVLPPELKVYLLRNPPTINYNYWIDNRRSMGRNNLIFGSHALHNIAKAYVNVINYITTFVEPNLPTNNGKLANEPKINSVKIANT